MHLIARLSEPIYLINNWDVELTMIFMCYLGLLYLCNYFYMISLMVMKINYIRGT